MKLPIPNEKLVREAVDEFDRENEAVEQALEELFRQYPRNEDLRHVVLKVTALNSLYSTQIPVYGQRIPDVLDVARQIHRNSQEIDSALVDGSACSPGIVGTIASLKVPGRQNRCYYAFATKYCSWHKPKLYPIWDSRVDRYLW